MTLIPKNMYIDKLDEIFKKYNNTYHITIEIESFDVNPNIYIDFNKENNDKDPKFKIDNIVRISMYKNFFTK